MNTINSNNHRHDRNAIKEFLAHFAGELRLREFALEGSPVSPKLQQKIAQFRARFGTELLPVVNLLSDDANRQAMVIRCCEQVQQVLSVFSLLNDLEI